ncbi:MAG: DoxX family protein [Pseudomonadales bacterium]|nr:DoxX family protein [Pseudomonadales bacterium]
MSVNIIKTRIVLYSWIEKLAPVLDIALRIWIARVFFMSGLTKIQTWESTLMLFEYEYAVPVIPFQLAAYMATAGELILPVLIAFGLFTRFGLVGLFILNLVAVISYPDISYAGIQQHTMWGLMMVVLFVHGPKLFSVDRWLDKRFGS